MYCVMYFTNDWFDVSMKEVWDLMIPTLKPRKVLEIGACEGRSTCYMIAHNVDHITVIDDWHADPTVKQRFDSNIAEALTQSTTDVSVIQQSSDSAVPQLDSDYDFVYIDGSHWSADVLLDSINAYNCLIKGGIICWDDCDRPQILPVVNWFCEQFAQSVKPITARSKTARLVKKTHAGRLRNITYSI